jgi:hypothetical protein
MARNVAMAVVLSFRIASGLSKKSGLVQNLVAPGRGRGYGPPTRVREALAYVSKLTLA